MLLFILYKDLNANPLQIGIFLAANPIVALFSVYWSFAVHRRGDRLRANIIWATILGYLPFFLCRFSIMLGISLALQPVSCSLIGGCDLPGWSF